MVRAMCLKQRNDLKYSMRPKFEEKDKKAFLPGPGAYDVTNTSMKYAAPPAYR